MDGVGGKDASIRKINKDKIRKKKREKKEKKREKLRDKER